MEPKRQTDARLLAVQRELIDREPIFHRPEYGTTRQAFEALTADDFWEVGASGRRYNRQFVIETLVQRCSAPHEDHSRAEDFYCQEIAPGHYLLPYTAQQPHFNSMLIVSPMASLALHTSEWPFPAAGPRYQSPQ